MCDRPRTYDKFYKKGPSNFQGIGVNGHVLEASNGIANPCSSEEEDIPKVSSGGGSQRSKRKKKRRGSEKLQYSRTITEKDVRSIERHLSMKKTIRKKIMRDLQQAFVEGDPNEISPAASTQTVSYSPKMNEIHQKSLNILNPKQSSKTDPRFLDLLRGDEAINTNAYSDDSGHCSGPSPTLPSTHYNHRAMLRSNVNNSSSNPSYPRRETKRHNFISDSGGSSCGGDESLENVVCDNDGDDDIIVVAAQQIEACTIDERVLHPADYHRNFNKMSKTKNHLAENHSNSDKIYKTKPIVQNKNCNYMNSYLEGKTIFPPNDNNMDKSYTKMNKDNIEALSKKSSNGKKTLWQKLTGGGGNCSGKNRDSSKRTKSNDNN